MRPPKQRQTGREIEITLGSVRGKRHGSVRVHRHAGECRGRPRTRETLLGRLRNARREVEASTVVDRMAYCDELGVATSTRSSASSCTSPSWRRATSPAPPSDDETPT